MTKTFTEIKQGLSKTIFLESQFKDFVTKVTANDTYIYQNEETSVHSQGYTGYKKWAEPVACLSRIASNYSSAKKLKEIIKEENLSTKDLYDLYLCHMACHRWILLSTEKSAAKDKVLMTREVLLDFLKDRPDCATVCLKSLSSEDIKDIVLYMGNMEMKSTLPLDEKAAPSDFVFWKMADLLLKEEFQLVKGKLDEHTIGTYIKHILDVKEKLTAEQNAYGIKDFTPLYLLRDQNYETYGKLLVKNKAFTDMLIYNWVLSSTKQNRDKDGECMFQDGGYSFLSEPERYYAYTHLVELSLEYKNYEALGQLLLLKATAYIPSTLPEIEMPQEVMDVIPWEDSMKRLGSAFSKSNRAFHLNEKEFQGLLNSQIFPYFLKLSAKPKDVNSQDSSDLYKSFAGINLGFKRLTGYCLWFLKLNENTTQASPNKDNLITQMRTLEHHFKYSLDDMEKSSYIEKLKDFYEYSALNAKGKENSILVNILMMSMKNNEIATKTLNNLKDFVFSNEQEVEYPFMSKATWQEMNTRFLSKKVLNTSKGSTTEQALKKKRRKILTP